MDRTVSGYIADGTNQFENKTTMKITTGQLKQIIREEIQKLREDKINPTIAGNIKHDPVPAAKLKQVFDAGVELKAYDKAGAAKDMEIMKKLPAILTKASTGSEAGYTVLKRGAGFTLPNLDKLAFAGANKKQQAYFKQLRQCMTDLHYMMRDGETTMDDTLWQDLKKHIESYK